MKIPAGSEIPAGVLLIQQIIIRDIEKLFEKLQFIDVKVPLTDFDLRKCASRDVASVRLQAG